MKKHYYKVIVFLSIFLSSVVASCVHMEIDGTNGSTQQENSDDIENVYTRPGCVEEDITDDEIQELIIRANSGEGEAAFKLYDYFVSGHEEEGDPDYWLMKAAELGNPNAQYDLGKEYLSGRGGMHPIIRDEEKGRYWLNKVADANGPFALGAKILLGMRLTEQEIKILEGRYEEGDFTAASKLYDYYTEIEPNADKAEYWIRLYREKTLKKSKSSGENSDNTVH